MKEKKTCFIQGTVGMMLLGAAGGFLDAYSFTVRGGVLATAQTGNIVFLCIALAGGRLATAAAYLFPILAFSAGVLLSGAINAHKAFQNLRHSRSFVLLFEAAVLVSVAFISESAIANAAISFVCGVQLTFFREINGNAAATTMCTGNLRSALEHLNRYTKTKSKADIASAGYYALIILAFLAGALAAAVVSPACGTYSAFIACAPLLLAALLHFLLD